MPRSQAAKDLEAKQKAHARAERERKKNSDNPQDWNQLRQLQWAWKETHKHDPQLPLITAACIFGPTIVLTVVGLLVKPWYLWLVTGILAGITLALWVFTRRQKRAAYVKYEGEAGSAELALKMLDQKKWTSTPAIAGTRQLDCIHRALGPGGLLLIADGDPGRLKPVVATEVKRHEQVAYGVKATVIQVGDGPHQVPLRKLADHIKKLPPTLDATKITEITKRLKAMDAMRARLPIPKGPIPTKGGRSALRGR